MDITNCVPENWISNSNEYQDYLQRNTQAVPLLNANSVENMKCGILVRFRGMIQDMYNPEYYYEKYETINDVTNENQIRNGKYRDAMILKENETFNVESQHNITSTRNTYVVITVPAFNTWARCMEKSKHICKLPTSNSISNKRAVEDEPMEEDNVPMCVTKNKKVCTDAIETKTNLETTPSLLSKDYILNFPIEDNDGMTCLIKTYEEADIKLNEMYEFVGFLSTDPIVYGSNDEEDDLEMQMHNPPSSLVPRIHCVSWKKLNHNNPLLDQTINYCDRQQASGLFKELHMIFTQILLGDSLAAHYVIYYLLSEVYLRRNMSALGKFALNISNIPLENVDYGTKFYEFLEKLLVKSHYLPLTLEVLNSQAFTPKKDYECNRLTSGILQLSKGTCLVLDETKLKEGKLNEAGLKNIGALKKLIDNQVVNYDFVYYQMEYDCDIPILTLSEGQSILPSDYHVRLQPLEVYVNTFDDVLNAISKLLHDDLLNKLRMYLTSIKFGQYNIGDNIQETIQNEFVNLRQETNCSVADLHQLLVLARLVCLANGDSDLNENSWKKAMELERERKSRL